MSATVTLPRHRRSHSNHAELCSRVRAGGLLGATQWRLLTAAVLGALSAQVAYLGTTPATNRSHAPAA